MNAITVLALEPRNDAVVEIVEAWVRDGLLEPVILVGKDAFADPPEHFAILPVRRLDPVHTTDTTLGEAFGSRTIETVRFVAVRPMLDGGPSADASDQLNRIASGLSAVLSDRTRLVRVNLIVPTDAQDGWEGLLERRWEVNVVVSPEDRAHDDAIDHGVHRPEAFAPHAALACVTVAGLWRNLPAGPFDAAEPPSAGNDGRIMVARAAARLVDGAALPDEVIERMIGSDVTALLSDLIDSGSATVENDSILVDEVSRALCENLPTRPFNFRPYRPPPPQPVPVFRHTVSTLIRALVQMVRGQIENRIDAAASLSEAVASWLLGSFRADVDETWRHGDVAPSPQQVREVAHAAPGLLPNRVPPDPFAWSALRQLCFALVDGGQFPAEVAEVIGTLKPRVSHAHSVVPEPHDLFTFDETEEELLRLLGQPCVPVRAPDLNAAAHVELRLNHAVSQFNVLAGIDQEPVVDPARSTRSILMDCVERFQQWNGVERGESLIGLLSDHVSEQLLLARDDLAARHREHRELEARRRALHDRLQRSHQTARRRRWVGYTAGTSGLALLVNTFLSLPVAGLSAALGSILVMVTAFSGLWWLARLTRYALVQVRVENELAGVERRRQMLIAAVEHWPAEADRLASVYEVLIDWGEIIGWMLHRPFGPGGDPVLVTSFDSGRPQAFRVGVARVRGGTMLDRLAAAAARKACGPGWLQKLYPYVVQEVLHQYVGERPNAGPPDPDEAPAMDVPAKAPGRPAPSTEPSNGPSESQPDPDGNGGGDGAGDGGPRVARSRRPFARYSGDGRVPAWNARARLVQHFRDGDCARIARRTMASRIRTVLRSMPPQELLRTVTVQNNSPKESAHMVSVNEFLSEVLPRRSGSGPCPPMTTKVFTVDGQLRDKAVVRRVTLWLPASFDARVETEGDSDVVVVDDSSGPTADHAPEQYRIQVTRLDLSGECDATDLNVVMPGR